MTEIEKLQDFRKFLGERAESHLNAMNKAGSFVFENSDPKSVADAFFHGSLNMQLDMGPEIHNYLKKNGIPELWPTEAMITFTSGSRMANNKALACPVHYLAAFRGNQEGPENGSMFIEKKHEIVLRGRYGDAMFTPKEQSTYDPEYARMTKEINSLPDRKYEAEKKIKDLRYLGFGDLMVCFFASLRGLFFSFVIAVIAAFVPVLVLSQMMDMSDSVVGPIALIVGVVAFFIAAHALEVTDFIDDVRDYRRQKREAKEAKRFLKITYPELVRSMEDLKKSDQYLQAQARNHKLYEEDVAFARLWESKWLEFCRQHPDPDFYV